MWLSSVLLFALMFVATAQLSDEEHWKNFKVKFDRKYDSPEEEQKRFNIFKDNLRYIESKNAESEREGSTFRLGINNFADLSHEEYVRKYTGGLRTH